MNTDSGRVRQAPLLKHMLLLIFLSLLYVPPLLAQPTITKLWDKRFGGSYNNWLFAMTTAPDGGYLLSGENTYASSSVGDITDKRTGYWLVKIGSDGTKAWDKTYGSVSYGFFHNRAMTNTPDGGVLLGGYAWAAAGAEKSENSYSYDYWIIKTNAAGEKDWDRTFSLGREEYLTNLITTDDGGYLLAGHVISSATYGYFWIIKLNPDGSKDWEKTFLPGQDVYLRAVAKTADGGYILGGETISGTGRDKTEPSRGGIDFWVVKINADGSKAWDKTLGTSGHDYLKAITATDDGGFLVGGNTTSGISGDKTMPSNGSADFWLIKLNADGSKAWDKAYGGNNADLLNAILKTPQGNYLLGGSSSSDTSGDKSENNRDLTYPYSSDFWVIEVEADGSKVWDKTFGGSEEEFLTTLLLTPDGKYLLGGHSMSGANGDKTEPGWGDHDFWVILLSVTD